MAKEVKTKPSIADRFKQTEKAIKGQAKAIEHVTQKTPKTKRGRPPSDNPLLPFGASLAASEIEDLKALTKANNISSVNQLVRYLLRHGIEQMKEGTLKPKKAETKVDLDLSCISVFVQIVKIDLLQPITKA